MAAADCTLDLAPGAAAVGPKTRVRASELLAWPRLGVELPISPDGAWSFGRDVRQLASAPAYAYVQDDPLNASDPSGFVGEALLGCADPTPADAITCPAGAAVTVLQGAALVIGLIAGVGAAAVSPGTDASPTPIPSYEAPGANLDYAKGDDTEDVQNDTGCLERDARRAEAQRRAANRAFDEIAKGLTKRQRERLHREVSKQGYTPQEIEDIADTLFGTKE